MKKGLYLPDGIEDLLPPTAWQFEQLRRSILELFTSWGFEYVEPPIIEYLDTLLAASGEDLDLQTLKVLDQVSGKQLGVRADLTSQMIRIDSQYRQGNNVQRYCYAGQVVYASPMSSVSAESCIIFGCLLSPGEELAHVHLCVVPYMEIKVNNFENL